MLPSNDKARLEKLREYDIVDTAPDIAFDTIAKMASEIFGASGAFVNFVDEEKVFFKANLSGFPSNEVARTDSLCSITILNNDITIFYDTHLEDTLRGNPYVEAMGGIRFYVGAPIKTQEGYQIGTVCIIDDKPREHVSDLEKSLLSHLAVIAFEKLESRRISRKITQTYDDQLQLFSHDLLNPLTSILLSSQVLQSKSDTGSLTSSLGSKIEGLARSMESKVNNLLSDAVYGNEDMRLQKEYISIGNLIREVASTFELSLKGKNQTLRITCDCTSKLLLDSIRIKDVITNLLSNASKYSYPGTSIDLVCVDDDEKVRLEFKDNGVGIRDEDLPKLFNKFAKLSSLPTGKERSHGLGLYIVKVLVELHGGKVWASSEGPDMGSCFYVELPKGN
jgi:K+-sensing histidine kinase KdpD